MYTYIYIFYFTCIDYGKIPQKLATLAASRQGNHLPGPRARKKTFSCILTPCAFCSLNNMNIHSVQFSSVTQSCPTLCDPMNSSTSDLPVHHQLPEFTQTHIHRVSDAIQPSHPLSSPSPPAPNPSQHPSLFQSVNSSHEVAKVLEFQLQHHSFQRNPRADLLQNGQVGPASAPDKFLPAR